MKADFGQDMSHFLNAHEVEDYLRQLGVEFDAEGSTIRIHQRRPSLEGPVGSSASLQATMSTPVGSGTCESGSKDEQVEVMMAEYFTEFLDPIANGYNWQPTDDEINGLFATHKINPDEDVMTYAETTSEVLNAPSFLTNRPELFEDANPVILPAPDQLVQINVEALIERLAAVSICTGQGPGYLPLDVETAVELSRFQV